MGSCGVWMGEGIVGGEKGGTGLVEEEEEDSSGSSGPDCPAYPHTGGSAPSHTTHSAQQSGSY